MSGEKLTQAEIDERTAVLRRFKKLLEEKRNKFREYLAALEQQEKSISEGNMAQVERQSVLEDYIVSELYTIQRVIDPIEEMYRDIHRQKNIAGMVRDSEEEKFIPKLQADLDKLQEDILRQNKKNRELLKSGMAEVRQEINSLKKPFRKKNVYASESGNASIIDIQT